MKKLRYFMLFQSIVQRYCLFKSKQTVGLDLNMKAINLVVLRHFRGKYGIETAIQIPLKSNQAVSMSQALTELNPLFLAKSARLVVALSDEKIQSTIVTLDSRLTCDELARTMAAMAEKQMGRPVSSLYFDFKVLGQSRHTSGYHDVLLLISPHEAVHAVLSIVEQAGGVVQVIDSVSSAYLRVFQQMAAQQARDLQQQLVLWAAVQDGISTYMAILRGESVIFSHEHRYSDPALSAQKNLLLSLKEMLKLFFATMPAERIHHIALSSVCSADKDWCMESEKILGIPFVTGHPFSIMHPGLSIDHSIFSKESSCFTLACGLALHRGAFYDG